MSYFWKCLVPRPTNKSNCFANNGKIANGVVQRSDSACNARNCFNYIITRETNLCSAETLFEIKSSKQISWEKVTPWRLCTIVLLAIAQPRNTAPASHNLCAPIRKPMPQITKLLSTVTKLVSPTPKLMHSLPNVMRRMQTKVRVSTNIYAPKYQNLGL